MASISPTYLNCNVENHTSKHAYVRLTITSITQTDGATNKTTVNWKITTEGTPWVTLYRLQVTLGGVTLYNSTMEFTNWSQGTVIKSGSTTFTNNADGSLSLSAYIKQMFYYGNGDSSRWTNPSFYQDKSGTFVCSSIPRAMAPSCTNTTLGVATTIKTNRASTAFTHTIRVLDGTTELDKFTGVTDSTPWTPTIATYAPYMTGGKTKAFTIESACYSGSTLIGTKTCSVTLTVPDSVKPTAAITIVEGNADMISKGWGVFVKGKSQLKVTVSGTKAYNAEITGYSSTVEGVTLSGATNTFGVLKNAGSASVSATVTDARTHTSDVATKSYSVVDYIKPSISGTVSRCDIDGKDNDEGEYIKYNMTGAISPVNNRNYKKFTLQYKQKGEPDTAFLSIIDNNDAYTISKSNTVITSHSFENTKSFDFRFVAEDSFESATSYAEIGTGFDIINVNKSGKSIAIGKISEATEDQSIIELGLETYYKEKVLLEYETVSTW